MEQKGLMWTGSPARFTHPYHSSIVLPFSVFHLSRHFSLVNLLLVKMRERDRTGDGGVHRIEVRNGSRLYLTHWHHLQTGRKVTIWVIGSLSTCHRKDKERCDPTVPSLRSCLSFLLSHPSQLVNAVERGRDSEWKGMLSSLASLPPTY